MAFGQIQPLTLPAGTLDSEKCKVLVTVEGEAPQLEVSQDKPGGPYFVKIDSMVTVTGYCICEDACPEEDEFKWEDDYVSCKQSGGVATYGSDWTWIGCVPAKGDCAALGGCVGSFGPIYVLKDIKLGEAKVGERLNATTDPCGFGGDKVGKWIEGNLSTQRDFLETILPNGVEMDCNRPIDPT